MISFASCLPMSKWGNKIDFVNELGIEIDSLEMVVCNTRSVLLVHESSDGGKYIDENPKFPNSGYPCQVKVKVYSKGKEIILQADTFDCYHCDNPKYYILRDGRAIFQTSYLAESKK